MNLRRLILQNIRYHARSWLLTISGAVIGTAVLTGAFITGDSVRYSLDEMVRMRLGQTRFAMSSSDRFVRSVLADRIGNQTGIRIIPVLQTRGIITVPGQGSSVNQAMVTGIGTGFFDLWDDPRVPETTVGQALPGPGEALISRNVADRLGIGPGDDLVLKIPNEGFASVNTPFVATRTETTTHRFRVTGVAGDHQGGRFSLNNNQSAPFNLFVSMETLAKLMEVPGYANVLLAVPGENRITAAKIDEALQRLWEPEDAGLIFTRLSENLYQATSKRIFIEDTLAWVIRQACPGHDGILTYLVNEIRHGGKTTPYSFVTAASATTLPVPLASGEIILTDWLAADLAAQQGDTITFTYWITGAGNALRETTARFRVKAVVPVENSTESRALMPDFPGLKNSGSCRDWETDAPIDLARIRDRDEEYWNRYRGTPKAWIRLDDGQQLWQNPFGRHTAFRFADSSFQILIRQQFSAVSPLATGLIFRSVYEEGKSAASRSTDFGELFMSLGGLIVIAGLMLSGMLLSLFFRQRMEEMALLRSIGFRQGRIMMIYFVECAVISVVGSLLGVLLAIGWSAMIVAGLNSLWQGAVNTSGLLLHVKFSSVVAGFLSGTLLNVAVFAYVLFRNRSRALPSVYDQPVHRRRPAGMVIRFLRWLFVILFFTAAVIMVIIEIHAGRFVASLNFMGSGVLLMIGFTGLFMLLLGHTGVPDPGFQTGLLCRALKNAGLHKGRTVGAFILLMLSAFTILVTGLNRKDRSAESHRPDSGTGGFRLWMETTIPLTADLNTVEGRKKVNLSDLPMTGPVAFVPLPEVSGDDASCLNLNQVSRPLLKGVPAELFDRRGSFSFSTLEKDVDRKHPWLVLEHEAGPGILNGFADQTVITWGLQMKTGDTLLYTDESGNVLRVRLAGGLENSVFQGSLLVSERMIRRHFPSSARVRSMLADLPEADMGAITRALEARLQDHGAMVLPAGEKLAAFDEVENTYLDVFMMLGGLGVLIGTAGLAVMVLRNLRDRRRELALYFALGMPEKLVYRLVSREYLFILISALMAGTVSALTGTLPSVTSGNPSGLALPAILITLVAVNGWLWIRFPVIHTMKHRLKSPASPEMTG